MSKIDKFRFRGTASVTTSIEDVPVGNKKAYKELFGEETPEQFINVVKLGENHPARPFPRSIAILTKEWAESFAQKVNDGPKPLYLRGHEDDESLSGKTRALPFGYVIGAKLLDDETLALKNAFKIPTTEEDRGKIADAMKEINAGMLSTSTGDYSKSTEEYDEETGIFTYKVIESVKAQTNALVESDQTGSDASITSKTFKSGLPASDDNNEQEVPMNLKEIKTLLKTDIKAGKLDPFELADDLGIETLTGEQKNSLKRLESAEKKLGNLDEYVEGLESEKKETFISLKDAALKSTFEDEGVRELATDLFQLKEGSKEEIDAEVTRIANKKSIQDLMAKEVEGVQHDLSGGTDFKVSDGGTLKA